MLFFQGVLLAGYAYAHGLQKLPFNRQWQVHLVVLIIAAITLPFTTPAIVSTELNNPTLSILLTLTMAIGLPYFALSSTGPLAQHWLSITNKEKVPYKLYSLSNTGSLLALISYPFIFEPVLSLNNQTLSWSFGFIIFVLSMGFLVRHIKQQGIHALDQAQQETTSVNRIQLSLWLMLSALGVMLLVSTTNAMTQNVAPMPFLWILPLALYLISFIIVFHSPHWYVRWYWFAFFSLCAFIAILLPAVASQFDFVSQVLMYSFILFAGCMVCHGELIKLAPATNRLTLFYLIIALGGVLGSAFVSLVAPQVFSQFTEYPLSILLTLAIFIVSINIQLQSKSHIGIIPTKLAMPALYLLLLGMVFLHALLDKQLYQHQIASHRNFYGLLAVVDTKINGTPERRLIDGTTSHGTQSLDENLKRQAKSYYRKDTGAALALTYYQGIENGLAPMKVGLIGLGAGTLATYGKPKDDFHFFEINPAVISFAQQHFTYLNDSFANISISEGDGRLLLQEQLNRQGSGQYDVIVLDAFSGDAIPAHLLTKEAFELYHAHLTKNGILAVHISNSHLDLTTLTKNLAASIGLEAHYFFSKATDDEPNEAQWMLMTNNQAFIERYQVKRFISDWPASKNKDVFWTDDYSNLLSVLK
ncbi:fused MFS/spermidine synthase [Thalassotalea algicola]|nr:fused MFS/spermidine synthase [Thalassotalea algicola]